jgi:phosphatidate cytidylyltransferase
MLRQRIQSGAIIIGLLLLAAFYAPPFVVLGIVLLVVGLGLVEFFDLLSASGITHQRNAGILGGLLYLLAVYSSYVCPCLHPEVASLGALFVILAALFLFCLVVKEADSPLETIAATFLGILYISFFSSFLIHLLFYDGSGNGKIFLLYLISVVKGSDIGAYSIGCWIGKHKFLPRISPKKTWEGVAGGVAASLLISLAWYRFTGGDLGVIRFSIGDCIFLGVLLPCIGIFGDLSESMLKREAKVKDSGSWINGMGGILDVVDSLLFAAPALYLYARQFQG